MARIRTIKPEFPQSESMGRVSRDARLLFVQMWTLADDAGRLRGNSRMLASLLFPYDDDAPGLIDGWMQELEREGCITRYVNDEQTYCQINKWLIHQKIDKPSPSRIPAPEESSRILANPRECSSLDQGSRIKDQGRDTPHNPRKRGAPSSVQRPAEISEQVWADWLRARKTPLTETAWEGVKREAERAGITPADAVRICAENAWRGFKAEWLKPKAQASPDRPNFIARLQEHLAQTQQDVIDV